MPKRLAAAGALAALGLAVLPACSARQVAVVSPDGLPKATDVALVRYSGCGQMLRDLRAAATAAATREVAGYGYGTAAGAPPGVAPGVSAAGPATGSSGVSQPSTAPATGYYSSTNDAVAGVDEPDSIKTDGQHIVTIAGGVLRVVDAQTHQLTGELDLSAWAGAGSAASASLLLSGDHALVLLNPFYPVLDPMLPPTGAAGPSTGSSGPPVGSLGRSPAWEQIAGPRLLLVDLSSGQPQVLSSYTMAGSLVDARLVGSIARVVVRSVPRLFLTPLAAGPGTGTSSAGRAVIDRTGLRSWLPQYAMTNGGVARTGQVSCADVSHPATASYSGGSMLTVLTFDLSGDSLGDGEPVTIVADGDTVYSNGVSLYVANDQQWATPPVGPPTGVAPGTQASPAPAPYTVQPTGTAQPSYTARPAPTEPMVPLQPQQYASLYKFSIAGPGRPVYEASGTVPGWLLGSAGMTQYSLSEWNGVLRVATTTGNEFAYDSLPQSAVYELEQVGDQLVIVGKVGGLGVGEQIYAVRFAGPVGYVVTFRQIDPLYTLDLSDPAQPRIVGELRLSGYSAYLDPIDATHIIGVGQATSALGETLGTQVGLFDVSDLAAPVRQAVYRLNFGHSDAEFDPHAFLYWPIDRVVVIPVQLPYAIQPVSEPSPGSPPVDQPAYAWPRSGALVLRVGEHSLTKLGMIRQPAVPGWPGGAQITRSLVIGNELWTLSDSGLQANDLTTLAPTGWIPFG